MNDSPVRKADVEMRKLGEEYLLHDPGTGALHVLNASARMVWEMCDGAHTLDDIERAMRDAYEVGDADVPGDLRGILGALREKGLLAASPG